MQYIAKLDIDKRIGSCSGNDTCLDPSLRQKRMQELSNMTLAELKEQGADGDRDGGPMKVFVGMGHNGRDEWPDPSS